MSKELFYKRVLETFFEGKTCSLKDFMNTLSCVMPVFGELESEITKNEDKTTIRFIDRDEADVVIAPTNIEITKEMLDMSSIVLVIHLDENDQIVFVEHGLGAFTPANKEIALFLASIVGKRVDIK